MEREKEREMEKVKERMKEKEKMERQSNILNVYQITYYVVSETT